MGNGLSVDEGLKKEKCKSKPSDTQLLLTFNYSEIMFCESYEFSQEIPVLEILRRQNLSNFTTGNSQRVIFVIISCQRVPP